MNLIQNIIKVVNLLANFSFYEEMHVLFEDLELLIVSIFGIECIIKILSLGVKQYLCDEYNKFDLYLEVSSFVTEMLIHSHTF